MNEAQAPWFGVDAIPHRPPFLFVDAIVVAEDRRIVTRWFADPASEFFRGHYPGRPIVPGVLLCECCFQAGALLVARRSGAFSDGARIPVVTRISDARFRRMMEPGQTAEVEVTLDEELDEAYYLTGRVTVEHQSAARIGFACMAAPA